MKQIHSMNESGLTLIEVMAGVIIMALILLPFPAAFRVGTRVWQSGDRHAEVVQHALIGLDQITRELRQARNVIAVSAADDTTGFIEFKYAIDTDDNMVDDAYKYQLYAAIDGYLQHSWSQNEEAVLADSLKMMAGPVTSLIFTCYEGDGVTETTTPADIASVRIQMVTIDSEGVVNPIPLSAWAYIRDFEEDEVYSGNFGILVGGALNAAGNFSLLGDCGSIHVNGDFQISGDPTISQNATCSGYLDIPGNPDIGGVAEGYVDEQYIPPVIPSAYLPIAEYVLKSNGDIYSGDAHASGAGIFLANEEYRGWKWGGEEKWEYISHDAYDGAYYVEADAIISSNAGTPSERWRAAIIAEGSISISGELQMEVYTSSIVVMGETLSSNMLFVAGGDLEISGNPEQIFIGHMLCHEQIKFNGNSTLVGSVIAEDAVDIDGYASENTLSGEFSVTYDGSNPPFLGAGDHMEVLSWRYL